MFLNACHSEKMARLIQDKLKIPIVIYIKGEYTIDDDAASEFAKQFYR